MSELALFHGEDFVSANMTGDSQPLAAVFRDSGVWEEVVPGMADLTVKYDPMRLTLEEAKQQFRRLWETKIDSVAVPVAPALLAVSFDSAPDLAEVAARLNIESNAFPQWFSGRSYRVAIMGFQPGLAYLEDVQADDIPALSRLDTPRQRVPAGSIGFLGKRACIYPFDGPGGWPIVGRVSEPLFRPDNPEPFLLQPGQIVRFQIA